MLKKLLGVVAVLGLCIGLVVADEYKGKVTAVNGTKITVENKKDNSKKEFDIAGAKVSTAVKGEAPVVADASAVKEKANVTVTYDGAKVSEVIVNKGKKK